MIHHNWLLWQLTDSAFPTGGFAHSGGLEAAKHAGQVRDEDDLRDYLSAVLDQAARSSLPYVISTHRVPSQFRDADAHCDAFLSNPIANRASTSQGNGWLAAAAAAFPDRPFSDWRKVARREQWYCHMAPTFGRICSELKMELVELRQLFLFVTVRTVLSAAIRLNVLGPLRCQAIQNEMSSLAQEVLDSDLPADFREVVQPAPLLDLWQSSHDRLYSRLFHS